MFLTLISIEPQIPQPLQLKIMMVVLDMGLTIENITITESPKWLKEKLTAIGLNPINNVVDITNFVM